MHSLTVPADKNITLEGPPVLALKEWMEIKFSELIQKGITSNKMIFDVGIGFGKTAAQSRDLIEAAPDLAQFCHKLGARILYGHSRKSFLEAAENNKDAQTARITAGLAAAKVDFARVHDIKSNLAAIKGSSN
jgi:2-amino-4-hydroxy-6-hydroxymethyldihydropteridine diphosphokinase / dihydropteroate synthase